MNGHRIIRNMTCIVGLLSLTPKAQADPIVPGFHVQTYASVTDPVRLAFDSAGNLFVGRDNTGSGGSNIDALKIHRIGVGGSSVVEYGNSAIDDPDAVIVDTDGHISGTPGAVLVGGGAGPAGKVSAIRPDGSIFTLFGPSTTIPNTDRFVFDSTGRLLFTDLDIPQVSVTTGGSPTVLFTLPARVRGLDVDAADRIFTIADDGTIRIHAPDGTLIDDAFVAGLAASPTMSIEFGPGTAGWSSDLYAILGDDLLRIDALGGLTVIGIGFDGVASDIVFGPSNSLYVSMFDEDRILRISPILGPLSPVPEPCTLTIWSLGIVSLFCYGRQRRKRAA